MNSTKTQSVITLQGVIKTREIIGSAVERRENITFLALPFVEESMRGSWTKTDGDIVVSCPVCGARNLIDLGREYRAKANGLLYPSVMCKSATCDFDHYVLLLGYNALGRFGRKRDNALGVIFYAMMWEKPVVNQDGKMIWQMQPCEYTHATDEAEARRTWRGLIEQEGGRIVGIAPSLDPHVSGDADPSTSVLHL